jgi:transposase-like protein
MKEGLAFWMEHVAAIKREGISASAYAKRHGVAVTRLYYWQRKLRAAAVPAEAIQPRAFVALRVGHAVGARVPANCTLVLESGMRLEMMALPTPEWLAALGRATQGVH